jgi:hypothetical protein
MSSMDLVRCLTAPKISSQLSFFVFLSSATARSRSLNAASLGSCAGNVINSSRKVTQRAAYILVNTHGCDRAPARRLQVEGYQSRSFDCEVGSHFHHGHVSGGPPIIPDDRISQVRFETWPFFQ